MPQVNFFTENNLRTLLVTFNYLRTSDVRATIINNKEAVVVSGTVMCHDTGENIYST